MVLWDAVKHPPAVPEGKFNLLKSIYPSASSKHTPVIFRDFSIFDGTALSSVIGVQISRFK